MIEDDGGFMRRETQRDSLDYPDDPECVSDEDVDFGDTEDAYWMGRD